jgi:hypothetical protein
MTLRDRYALGLSACGYQRQKTASKKYWLYRRDVGLTYYVWIGKSGAVRFSASSTISSSRAMSDQGKESLLIISDKAKGEAS